MVMDVPATESGQPLGSSSLAALAPHRHVKVSPVGLNV